MRHLRYSIIAVVAALTFLFNIERLDFDEANAINISSFVYGLAFLVMAWPLVFRRQAATRRWIGSLAVFWVVAYLIGKLFFFSDHPAWGGVYTYLTITELAIILVLTLLSGTLVGGLREFEEAVATLTLPETNGRIRSIDDAREDIRDRVLLSRRHQRPLSLLVFSIDRTASAGGVQRIVEEVQRGMANRYVVGALANVLVRGLRRTDLPLEQGGDGRFVVLCPETDASGAGRAAIHVQKALLSDLGVHMNVGIAAFPGDALTFEELLRHAEGQLNAEEPLKLVRVGTSRA